MQPFTRSLGVLAVLLPWLQGPMAAQIDYRNLDDDRPLATEDAYPVERHAFEFLLPYIFERERDGGRIHALVPELVHGIIRNGQLGMKLSVAGRTVTGDTDWGLAGLRVFGLYNLNTESRTWPAVSGRVDLLLPVGSLGGSATRVSLKAIATRSWGRRRLHLNAGWTLGRERRLSAVEPGSRWRYGLAVDQTLFRQNLLLAGEIVAQRPTRGEPVEVNLALGTRVQWTPTLVLDLGLRRRLRAAAGPDLGVTAGLSHAFALPWLMPAGQEHPRRKESPR